MRPTARTLAHRLAARAAAGLVLAGGCLPAAAPATTGSDVIYTCTDASGKRHTADRLIAACMDREQRVLGRDGSLVRVIAPTLTATERAESEAREQRLAAARQAQQDLARRDRSLVQRYPNEAAHAKAREAALEPAQVGLRASEQRVKELTLERKPLLTEAEFYVGKALPLDLKLKLDGNDAAVEAQRAFMQNQQAEISRINAGFDAELVRLKKLWAGATPGSLGPLDTAAAPATNPKH
jgi:hypothetical protein